MIGYIPMEKNKKIAIFALSIGAIIIAVLTILVILPTGERNADTTSQEPVRRRISEPVNEIEVAQRPYIQLTPQADGRNLTISVLEVKKSADLMEYELEYQAGSTSQGEFNTIDLATLPASNNAFFGSCSAGGACTYHEDIKGGSLLGRFISNTENGESYALKQDWRYFDTTAAQTQVASRDAQFQLEASAIANQRFIVVYNTPGFPGDISEFGELASDIYSLRGNTAFTGTGELSIRAHEATSEERPLTILGFNGTEWVAFETTSDGRMASAEVDLVEAYLVVN